MQLYLKVMEISHLQAQEDFSDSLFKGRKF